MKIGLCYIYVISKYGYPPSLEDTHKAIREMADMGFRYIELEGVRERHLLEVRDNRESLKETCDKLGVRVVNFCPILPDLVSLDEHKRQKALELFGQSVELARYFGCESVQLDSFLPPLEFVGAVPYREMINYGLQFRVKIDPHFKWEELWSTLIDSVSRCNRMAKEAGLKLTMEPRVGEIISNTDALLRLMDAVDDSNFGATLDTAHQHAQKEILPLSVEKLGKKILYLHVADNDGKVNEHLALGRGTIDWEGLFLALKKHGFDGHIALDIGRVPNLEEQILESKSYLEELLTRVSLLSTGS